MIWWWVFTIVLKYYMHFGNSQQVRSYDIQVYILVINRTHTVLECTFFHNRIGQFWIQLLFSWKLKGFLRYLAMVVCQICSLFYGESYTVLNKLGNLQPKGILLHIECKAFYLRPMFFRFWVQLGWDFWLRSHFFFFFFMITHD